MEYLAPFFKENPCACIALVSDPVHLRDRQFGKIIEINSEASRLGFIDDYMNESEELKKKYSTEYFPSSSVRGFYLGHKKELMIKARNLNIDSKGLIEVISSLNSTEFEGLKRHLGRLVEKPIGKWIRDEMIASKTVQLQE